MQWVQTTLVQGILTGYTANMRLFYALLFDEPTMEKISAIQAQVKKAAAKGSFTARDNLHLTLAFVGEQPEEMLPALRGALDFLPLPPMVLEFDRLGKFSKRNGDIIWLGTKRNQALHKFQKELAYALEDQMIPFDQSNFKAHLSLARRVRDCPLFPIQGFSAKPAGIALMHSHQVEGKLTYTPLFFKPF